MCDKAPDTGDPLEGRALWCELWIHLDGVVSLTRGLGCTRGDAIELCRLAAADDPAVVDRTDDATVDSDHPSFSWLRYGS